MATISNENTNIEVNISSDDNALDNNSPTNESNGIEIKYDEQKPDNKASIELVTATTNNSQSTETQPTTPPLKQNNNITQTQTKIIITSPPNELQQMNSQTTLIPQSSEQSPSPSPINQINHNTLSIDINRQNDHTNNSPQTILTPSGIKLKRYDFTKLVPDKISYCEHFVIFLTTISLWFVLTTS
eukprot:338048_1